jgi:hypothetical protein
VTTTYDQDLSWCSWVAAAIDSYPMAKARWAENAARSDMITKAHDAMERGDLEGCNAILSDLVAKADWDESKHHRDQRGRFSHGVEAVAETAGRVARVSRGVTGELEGQPARLAGAVANTANRIGSTARQLQAVVESIGHLRSGTDVDRHIVGLVSSLRALHGELGQLARSAGTLGHEGKAALLGARGRLRRLRDTLRSMRGKSIGKAAPVSAAITLPPGAVTAVQRLSKAEIARRDMLQHRLQLLRDQRNNAARNWRPLTEAHHHEQSQ